MKPRIPRLRTQPALLAMSLGSIALAGCHGETRPRPAPGTPAMSTTSGPAVSREAEPGETHLANVRQLTFRGENAEAYFSFDGTQLIFQSRQSDEAGRPECDQIYRMNLDGSGKTLVSTGKGRTTCAYFMENDRRVIYSSTHLGGDACPEPPEYRGGYVWPIFPTYDIFSAKPDGSDLRRLTTTAGYDAEATLSTDGSRVIFTSVRDGDLELYSMAPDGSDQRRLTNKPGYDGGAFFSPDGTMICYRSYHPANDEELRRYRDLLAMNLVEPSRMEIFVARADGSDARQVTSFGRASFAPFFHPSGKKILFSSNFHNESPRDRNFDIFMVDLDGENLERITHHETFDSFPMFSPDGKTFVWCSNRHAAREGDTNVFIADWVE